LTESVNFEIKPLPNLEKYAKHFQLNKLRVTEEELLQ
jgi:hypothetical protein